MINLDRLVAALGGAENIDTIEPCITRLRTEVHDPGAVDRAALRGTGALRPRQVRTHRDHARMWTGMDHCRARTPGSRSQPALTQPRR